MEEYDDRRSAAGREHLRVRNSCAPRTHNEKQNLRGLSPALPLSNLDSARDHAHRGENIKQYVIGREVFDRREDFDPRADSIVRTEARRLRRKLREYYESEGRSDAIQISFKPGSYIAHFQACDRARKPQEKQAIAVLLFENLTANPELGSFSRGMTESIQARLASSPGLKVISTVSAFRYGSESDPATIASDLGATVIVQGGIRQASDRIRVHAKAVETRSGKYLWAGVYDRKMSDLFAVEDEIASSVGDATVGHLFSHQVARSLAVPPLEAYELYLQGRQHWNKLSPEGCEQAVECLTRAILLSPDYAEPYAALADAYLWLIFFSTREPLDLLEPIKKAALSAIHLDRNCAEAYIALGTVAAILESRWNEAERLFRQGLQLRPSSVPGLVQRSLARMQTGDLERARLDQEAALELDPLSPRCHRATGFRLYLQRDFEAALISFGRALQLGPGIKHTQYFRGLALLQAGRHRQAVEALLRSLNGSKCGLYMGALVVAYAASGRKRKAALILQDLEKLATHAFVSPIAFVHAYAGMGELDKSFEWLNRAAERRFLGLMHLKLDPRLDSLRNKAQFSAALHKVNLGPGKQTKHAGSNI